MYFYHDLPISWYIPIFKHFSSKTTLNLILSVLQSVYSSSVSCWLFWWEVFVNWRKDNLLLFFIFMSKHIFMYNFQTFYYCKLSMLLKFLRQFIWLGSIFCYCCCYVWLLYLIYLWIFLCFDTYECCHARFHSFKFI